MYIEHVHSFKYVTCMEDSTKNVYYTKIKYLYYKPLFSQKPKHLSQSSLFVFQFQTPWRDLNQWQTNF